MKYCDCFVTFCPYFFPTWLKFAGWLLSFITHKVIMIITHKVIMIIHKVTMITHKVIMIILIILFAKVGLPGHHPHWVGGEGDQDGGKGRRNQRGGRINTETGHQSACSKLLQPSFSKMRPHLLSLVAKVSSFESNMEKITG